MRLKLVSDPQLALDGRLAFVESWLDDGEDRRRRAVLLLRPQSSVAQPLSPDGGDAWCPRWSPDGDCMAMISTAGGSAQATLWRPGSPAMLPLVAVPGDVTEVSWSPDGRGLAVTCVVREELAGSPAIVQSGGPVTVDGLPGLVRESRRIFLLGTDGAPAVDVFASADDAWYPRWSPAGDKLACLASVRDETGSPGPAQVCLTHLDRADGPGELAQLAEPAGGLARSAVALAGPAVALTWSPSGEEIAYLGPREGEQVDLDCRLFRCPADGGAAPAAASVELAADWDRSLGSTVRSDDARGTGSPVLLWSAATDRIYFSVADGGRGTIGWAAPHSDDYGVLLGGDRACLEPSLDPAGRALAFVSTDPSNPGDIWVADVEAGSERQVTDVNNWLAELSMAPTRPVTACSTDGSRIGGWLTMPERPAGGKCPLVVSVHGGPHYPVGWRFSFETQRLAARGYAVLAGNPRGSGGYGADFAGGIQGSWGSQDWVDLEGLIDAAVAAPGVDGGRIALTGVSYGGYLTLRVITLSRRFSVAISENGISNFLALWGAGGADVSWLARELGGTPWERADDYVAASPLTVADQIRTPLLLIHSELDRDCPIGQSEQMLVALRRLGRVVELVRLEGEGHLVNLVGRPSRRLARARAVDEWLDRYLMRE